MQPDPFSVIEDAGYDLDTLAFVTGIDRKHLQQIFDKKVLPDWPHTERLIESVPALKRLISSNRPPEEPEVLKTPKGDVPSGHVLTRYVKISSLLPNDLLAYRPYRPSDRNGSNWVRVLSTKRFVTDQFMFTVFLSGEVEFYAAHNSLVTIARPISNRERNSSS